MNILVIGGTRFVGRHLVEAARAKGHTISLFNRGHQADVFPELSLIQGDRNKKEDLAKLQGQSWDAVIDTCAYVPRQVRELLERIAFSTKHYTLISSISVYANQSLAFQDETAELASLADVSTEEINGETYGGLKVLCEQVAEQLMPNRNLIPRLGLVVGPFDPTDRFTYWPYRVARGSEVLAPDRPEKPVQFIDARDLAKWTIASIEANRLGSYNLVTSPDQISFGSLLECCKEVSQSDARVCWLDEAFLAQEGLVPWMDLPLWIPGVEENFLRISNQKALEAGLCFHSLKDTVKDTLLWLESRGAEYQWKAGISFEKEQQVLKNWHQRR